MSKKMSAAASISSFPASKPKTNFGIAEIGLTVGSSDQLFSIYVWPKSIGRTGARGTSTGCENIYL